MRPLDAAIILIAALIFRRQIQRWNPVKGLGMIGAYRCSGCASSWPPESEYRTCPECGGSCSLMATATPMSQKLAESRKASADFERHYADLERKRKLAGLPSPEEIGSIEAREILEFEAALAESPDA